MQSITNIYKYFVTLHKELKICLNLQSDLSHSASIKGFATQKNYILLHFDAAKKKKLNFYER